VKVPVYAAVALTLGALVSLAVGRMMNDAKSSAGPKIVVVEQPIEAGKPVKANQIKVIDLPPGTTPPQAVSTRANDVVGRIARESMIPGEPVLIGKLAPINATGGLSSIIPEGKRAITVKVNEEIAVAGFALPGSYVDVLVSGKDENNQYFSRTVLSRVKVLAIAQDTAADPSKPKVVNAVTLELTPRESETLDLARSIGELAFVLRNELDTTEVISPGVRMPDIISPQLSSATPLLPTTQAVSPVRAKAVLTRQSNGPEEIRGTSHDHADKP
jgi:pilus assembly protein CpaB